MLKVKQLLIMSLVVALLPVIALGQQTSSATGVVTDATGAVIPGVDVKLTDTRTAAEQTTKTNEQGVYSFIKAAPGTDTNSPSQRQALTLWCCLMSRLE